MRKALMWASTTALVTLGSGTALAQTVPPATASTVHPNAEARSGNSEGAGEIVVTAQRRSEVAQRVPISLTALPASTLEKLTISNVLDLQRAAPSFSAYRAPQVANTRLSIRGIGTAGNAAIEPSVGAYVDGIYIPRPGPLLAGLNDVAGVEVLSGPQGTLFGRNASVGAISIRTTEPGREFGGSAMVEYGSYDRWRANAILNVPAGETVSTRLSVLYDEYGGYGVNTFDGQRFGKNRLLSLRGAIRAELAPNLTWLLRGDYQMQRGDGQTVITVDAATVTPTAAANFRTRLNGLEPILNGTYDYNVRQTSGGVLNDDQWGVASDLSLALGDYTVRLLSGYRDWDNRQSDRDISLTAADVYGRDAYYRSKSHSEELQLISPADAPLSFVAGLYYFREIYTLGANLHLNPGFCNIIVRNTAPANLANCLSGPQTDAGTQYFSQTTNAWAAYGQATYKLTPQWDVTVGLRYSQDDKTATLLSVTNNLAFRGSSVPDSASLAFNGGQATYRVGTTFRPVEDVMLYATVSSGYKSGGFDSGFGTALGNNRVFNPETTINYEIGAKTQFLNRRLTANATFFRMDIDQFQLRAYNGIAFSVRNAGSIRQQGVEFELSARPTRELTLSVSGTRLMSEYTDFRNAPGLPGFGGVQNLTGQRVPFSPEWQGVASADYKRTLSNGLSVGLNTHLSFISDIDVGGAGDNNPQGYQSGYALLGGRLSLYGPQDRWELAVSGENLTKQGYCTLKYAQTFGAALGGNNAATGGTVQRCVLGDPRVIRVTGKIRF